MKNKKLDVFHEKVKTLFEQDDFITVGDMVYDAELDGFIIDIQVEGYLKYLGLSALMRHEFCIDGTKIYIDLTCDNKCFSTYELLSSAFSCNEKAITYEEGDDDSAFLGLAPEIISINKNDDNESRWTGLLQDIAEEIFDTKNNKIHFYTETENYDFGDDDDDNDDEDNSGDNAGCVDTE